MLSTKYVINIFESFDLFDTLTILSIKNIFL